MSQQTSYRRKKKTAWPLLLFFKTYLLFEKCIHTSTAITLSQGRNIRCNVQIRPTFSPPHSSGQSEGARMNSCLAVAAPCSSTSGEKIKRRGEAAPLCHWICQWVGRDQSHHLSDLRLNVSEVMAGYPHTHRYTHACTPPRSGAVVHQRSV